MLKDDLLLDSARPFSDVEDNILSERRETVTSGVLSSYLQSSESMWFVLRVSYSRELKISERLNGMGIRTFVPMMWRRRIENGKEKRELVPAVNNLCFAFSNYEDLVGFIKGYGDKSPVHFYWDRTANRPLVVPQKAMEDFMTVASAVDHDILYIQKITPKLREGQTVTVIDGPFKGITGRIVRIKKSRRVLVELPDLLAAATAYINPRYLSIQDEDA